MGSSTGASSAGAGAGVSSLAPQNMQNATPSGSSLPHDVHFMALSFPTRNDDSLNESMIPTGRDAAP